ncbi:Outer membrane protein assembly factor BamC [Legionella quinlivanii]|uniref:Outer membrane protein assembly factor BamC n=1 Tax=Legionella quinlivanii TaxID=45073 RepID=A0A0W0Y0K0_9GAMM|nr:hypothetical protein [Legionella quinlivanii]KTD50166.1 Outer membrane protein assembly factor BamC [Legionella quinlivanii]MCW8450089.1 hypothetical protein [Legionella quinlivanii]RAP35527.1 hypothetical protein B1207_12605 [Legionella quinlivanii]SEF48917.1 hypothetical protein SAMN02746093_00346 [Legionella quinlivanii DSM 21216]STY11764.1 Uncharacterised protein [Legionella quinlivanii]
MGIVVKKCFIVMVIMVLLSSCSRYASNGESLYLRSQNGPSLNVPSPLTSDNISHFYDLPDQKQNAVVSIVPPIDAGAQAG